MFAHQYEQWNVFSWKWIPRFRTTEKKFIKTLSFSNIVYVDLSTISQIPDCLFTRFSCRFLFGCLCCDGRYFCQARFIHLLLCDTQSLNFDEYFPFFFFSFFIHLFQSMKCVLYNTNALHPILNNLFQDGGKRIPFFFVSSFNFLSIGTHSHVQFTSTIQTAYLLCMYVCM